MKRSKNENVDDLSEQDRTYYDHAKRKLKKMGEKTFKIIDDNFEETNEIDYKEMIKIGKQWMEEEEEEWKKETERKNKKKKETEKIIENLEKDYMKGMRIDLQIQDKQNKINELNEKIQSGALFAEDNMKDDRRQLNTLIRQRKALQNDEYYKNMEKNWEEMNKLSFKINKFKRWNLDSLEDFYPEDEYANKDLELSNEERSVYAKFLDEKRGLEQQLLRDKDLVLVLDDELGEFKPIISKDIRNLTEKEENDLKNYLAKAREVEEIVTEYYDQFINNPRMILKNSLDFYMIPEMRLDNYGNLSTNEVNIKALSKPTEDRLNALAKKTWESVQKYLTIPEIDNERSLFIATVEFTRYDLEGNLFDKPPPMHIHINASNLSESIKQIDDFLFNDPIVALESYIALYQGCYDGDKYVSEATFTRVSDLSIGLTNFGNIAHNKERGGAFFGYFINSDIFTPVSEEIIKQYETRKLKYQEPTEEEFEKLRKAFRKCQIIEKSQVTIKNENGKELINPIFDNNCLIHAMIEDKFNPEIIEQMKTVIIGRYSSTKTMNEAMKRFGIHATVKYSVKVCDSEKEYGKTMDSNTVSYGDKDSMTTIELCSVNKHYFLNFDIDNHLYNHVLLKCGIKKTNNKEHSSMYNLITKLFRITNNYHAERTEELTGEDERLEPYFDEPDVIEPFIKITLMDAKVLTSTLHQHVKQLYTPNKFININALLKLTRSNTHQKAERIKKIIEKHSGKKIKNEKKFEELNKKKKLNVRTTKESISGKAWIKMKQIEKETQLMEYYLSQIESYNNQLKELNNKDLKCINIKLNDKINEKNVFYIDFECFAQDVHKSYGACMV